jgi:hypothetical protein
MPVEVRPARENDIDALLIVEQQCFDVYYYSRYQFSRDDFQNNRCWRDAVYEYDNPDHSKKDKLNESSPSSKGTDADLFWWFFISHKIYLLL